MFFLKFLKISTKMGLRTASNKKYRKDETQAHFLARKTTGIKIARGKKQGYWVDGKATYQREYKKLIAVAQDRKTVRDKAIDEI